METKADRLTNLREINDKTLDFSGAATYPIHLAVAHRLVYAPHNYGWSQKVPQSYEEFKQHLDKDWGWLHDGHNAAPIWLGEIGVCQNPADCGQYGDWFSYLARYLHDSGASWGYWALNATQSSGASRLYGTTEGYGLLTTDYQNVAAPDVLKMLTTAGLSPEE